ncbi:MAG: hypothetical protein ACR2KC_08350 [Acidimicrobiales bacterium]
MRAHGRAALNLDPVDECLEEALLSFGVAVLDGIDDVAAEPIEMGLGDGGLSFDVEERCQFALASLEGGDLSSEDLDALPTGRLGKGASFEGEEVPLDGFLGFRQFGANDTQLVL